MERRTTLTVYLEKRAMRVWIKNGKKQRARPKRCHPEEGYIGRNVFFVCLERRVCCRRLKGTIYYEKGPTLEKKNQIGSSRRRGKGPVSVASPGRDGGGWREL